MRWIAIVALLALPIGAQDENPRIEKAKALEAKAEKLLADGKRVEAFEALAKAAELRRGEGEGKPAAAAKEGEPAPKPQGPAMDAPQQEPNPKVRTADPVEIAHTELDLALKAGNLDAARKASARLHDARAEQAKRVAGLEKRLAEMERQLAEIRELLGAKSAR